MSSAGSAEVARLAADFGLPRLGGRPRLGRYVQLLWARRHFMLELARSRFQAEVQRDRLGLSWIVLRPLINAVVYGTVFGLLMPSSTRPGNYVAFLVSGIFMFQFFAGCLSSGAKSLTGNLGLIRALHFPRALLPTATVLQEVFALIPMTVVLGALVLATGEPLRWTWFQLVPALLLLILFSLGVAFFTARLTLHVRDVAQLIPFASRVLFYISGIFYSITQVTEEQWIVTLLQANPIAIYLTLVRGALMPDLPAPVWMWWAGLAWSVIGLIAAFLFFWHAEERYGRE